MKLLLLVSCWLGLTFSAFAQAPTIEGDIMLCPSFDSYGTATVIGDVTYDTYQWYSEPVYFSNGYEPIEGAIESSFTYDWYTYDVNHLKVVVTKDGETFESNVLLIDSYNWASLLIEHQYTETVVYQYETGFYICEGDSIRNTVSSPYTVVQWYKDGEPIEGATAITYTITEPGVYRVVAAPAVCPMSTSTSPPIIVNANLNCNIENITPVIDGKKVLCAGETATASLTNGLEYDEYYWQVKRADVDYYEDIEGANDPTFTYSAEEYATTTIQCVGKLNGLYYVSNEIEIELDADCTASVNNPHATAFTLYPNPANTVLNVNMSNGKNAESYIVYDVTGKTLLQGTLSGTASAINIEGLANGSYLIKVSGQNTQSTKMFIKQ